MREYLVSADLLTRVCRMTDDKHLVETELKKFMQEEPKLYLGTYESVRWVTKLLRKDAVEFETIEAIDFHLGTLISRMYLGMRLGFFDLWLDVSDMRTALEGLKKKHPRSDGKSDKQGDTPSSPDDSFL